MTTGAMAALDSMGGLDQKQQSGSNKTAAAAKDFEALLMGQILKSAHSSSGWLGTDDDDAGEAAIGLGEEQLARTMAQSGGFGLSKLIESGIRTGQDAVDTASSASKLPPGR